MQKNYPKEALPHLVTSTLVKQALPDLNPDSHKGQNGRLLIIASSPLFHGSGILATTAAAEAEAVFGMRTNDWLYYCSTEENINLLKSRYDAFLGITREMVPQYLQTTDVVVIGPGLMREPQEHLPETRGEPEATKRLTRLVLTSGKKAVLDAGSLQVINPDDLKHHPQVIITPHILEMANLFSIDRTQLQTSHTSPFSDVSRIAQLLQDVSKKYSITILLKGPIDIVANETNWLFSPGGTAELTRGGTGDVLAGVVGALYNRTQDPLIAASAGSFLIKRTGERLAKQYAGVYDATDVAKEVGNINEALRQVTTQALNR